MCVWGGEEGVVLPKNLPALERCGSASRAKGKAAAGGGGAGCGENLTIVLLVFYIGFIKNLPPPPRG